MTISQLVLIGDSLTQGDTGGFTYGWGGKGSWAQNVTDRLANLPGVGPLVSSGFMSCVRGWTSSRSWSFSAGWTDTATTDAWDITPYGISGATKLGKYASTSSQTVTFTATKDIRYPN